MKGTREHMSAAEQSRADCRQDERQQKRDVVYEKHAACSMQQRNFS